MVYGSVPTVPKMGGSPISMWSTVAVRRAGAVVRAIDVSVQRVLDADDAEATPCVVSASEARSVAVLVLTALTVMPVVPCVVVADVELVVVGMLSL